MTITFTLTYSSRWGENLYLVGNQQQTGCWNTDKAVLMNYVDADTWQVEVDVEPGLEYKYFVNENGHIRWEYGDNRVIVLDATEIRDGFRDNAFSCNLSETKLFQTVSSYKERHLAESSRWKIAGVAVPMFSLRSKNSFGIGDISDLKLLADWCGKCGLKVIQLLPINDTTAWRDWSDSYPYNAISAFAINPIYLDISKLGLEENLFFTQQRNDLNALKTVEFPEVLKLKWEYFKEAYRLHHNDIEKKTEYRDFIKQNKDWLDTYVAFCTLRDRFNTPDFSQWGKYAVYDKEKIHKLLKEYKMEVGIHYFLQYHLHLQMRDAVDYVHSKGIALKGDIAIGVSPHSAEAWAMPDLFDNSMSAGAPPDAFSDDGQVWGFPTYRWDIMANDNYNWWQKRLQNMAQYFDAYRIDHILGFFRIWEVPRNASSALLGHFKPALPFTVNEIEKYGFRFDEDKHVVTNNLETLFVEDPYHSKTYHPRISLQKTKLYESLDEDQKNAINHLYYDFFYHRHTIFWKDEAMRKLPALLNASAMAACGEDLGMIPDGVSEVMKRLGIFSLEVQRMPKNVGQELVNPQEVDYGCVYTTGTHDMPTLRGWLGNCDNIDNDHYNDYDCKITGIVSEALKANAALVILPLQDYLDTMKSLQSPDPNDDFINNPADAQNKWRYRIRCALEDIIDNEKLNSKLKKNVTESHRL